MRYLKKFNENIDNNDIKSFCDNYLAYLLDDGFKIVYHNRGNGIEVDIVKPTREDTFTEYLQIFSWDNIKDYFIPFIETLKDTYVISNDTFWVNTDRSLIDITTNDIINDIDNINIRKIKFIIKFK